MTEYIKPLYTVYEYAKGVYKVVKFKRSNGIKFGGDEEEKIEIKEGENNQKKLQNNISRAKGQILQLALCNDWEYFFTGTLDKEKYNRFDLEKYQKDLSQWFRNQGKKWNTKIDYMFVPEEHEDGAWHTHGLLRGINDSMLSTFRIGEAPIKLIKKGYLNYNDYQKKFGYISLGKVKSEVAIAFYITKYISKSITANSMELGTRSFYSSINLKRATPIYDVYYEVPELDRALQFNLDFCSVGIIQKQAWHYGFEHAEFRNCENDDIEDEEKESIEDKYIKYFQEIDQISLFNILVNIKKIDKRTGEIN